MARISRQAGAINPPFTENRGSDSQEEAVSKVKPSVLTPDQERQAGLWICPSLGMQALWAREDVSIARPRCDCPGPSWPL